MLKKIASNTLAQIFSKILTASITIILLGILTKYLSIELFGVYNKIFNYIYIFAFLVDLGLYAITIKEISANQEKKEYIVGNIASLRVISAFGVIVFSIIIAYFLPSYNNSGILFGIFLASLFSFFSLINSSLLAIMQSFMKMEFSIISVVINKLFVLFSIFVLTHYFSGKINSYNIYFYLIIAFISIGMFINMILNYFYTKNLINISPKFDKIYIKKIFYKTLPYGIALFLSVVYTKIDIFIISLMEKGVIAERSIALYSLPLKIMDVFMIIGGFFMNSLLPNLSLKYKEKKLKEIKIIITNTLKIMFAIGIAIIFVGLNYKENIIKIIANQNYLEKTNLNYFTSSDAFSIVLFMILFFYLGIVFSYMLIAFDKQKKLLKISIILTIINIIGNIILIPYLSFIGAGITTVLTQIIYLILIKKEANNYIKIKLPLKFMFKITIFGILGYFLIKFFISNFSLGIFANFIYGIIIFIIYSGIIYLLEFKNIKNNKKI